MTLKWGICCCGLISQDFTSAFCEYDDSRNKVVAVAGRNENSAKLFSEKFGIKLYFGSYERLALCEEVDIVYVGSITSEHSKLTKLFLTHGKHVLVEKSMGINAVETKEMVELAKEKGLFLMEGLWSRCFPIYKKIRDTIANGDVGTIKHVNVNFDCHLKAENVWSKAMGGGGMKAIGIYSIQFALWAFHDKKLDNVTGNIKMMEDGVDMCGNIMMEFEENCTAFVSFHAGVNGNTSASIIGSDGTIVIPDHFWAPSDVIINGVEDHTMATKRNNLNYTYNFGSSWGFTHEINHVADCMERGLLESNLHPLGESVRLAEIMDKLLNVNN